MGGGTSPAKASSPAFVYPLSTIIIMSGFELFLWIIFTLLFSLIPLKPLFRLFLEPFWIKDTTPFLYEAGEHEHYSQLYRPGDRKYKHIIELCKKAKPIN